MEAVNSVITCSATVGVVLSIIMYGFGVWLRDKTKIDALNPLLISIASIIVFLLVFHVDYKNYEQSAQYLSYLLTPATVALAIPLYKQLEILKKNIKAILTGWNMGSVNMEMTYGDFLSNAPAVNPRADLITGSVCGVKVEEIEDPLTKRMRQLDKLIDELSKGKPMDKILR